MKKFFSILAFSAVVCFSATSWAETVPLEQAADGVSVSAKGIATTLSTPVVMLSHLADGNLPEAAGSVVIMPVKGLVNTTAGAVITVSGIGRGAAELMDLAFGATGKMAEQSLQPTGNNLP